ncbi:hypothetical protein [Nitrosococcus halophilus]|uniref:hypothetical protein n=1 Tax=Nitrosococcus halophilus TaxID=133539 RepID=UPI0002FB6852|nr:hypothetical protein [Nitrosococcus halophilus]
MPQLSMPHCKGAALESYLLASAGVERVRANDYAHSSVWSGMVIEEGHPKIKVTWVGDQTTTVHITRSLRRRSPQWGNDCRNCCGP